MAQQKTILITGKINQMTAGNNTWIFLSKYYGKETIPVDSVQIMEDGLFKMGTYSSKYEGLYQVNLKNAPSATLAIGKQIPLLVGSSYDSLKLGSIKFYQSAENTAYAYLDKMLALYKKNIDSLNDATAKAYEFDPFFDTKTEDRKKTYILHQQEFNKSLRELKQKYKGTFTADVLISLNLTPNYMDYPEFADKYDNNKSFLHTHYFDYINFADERILNAPKLEERFMIYLSKYSELNFKGFTSGVDYIINKASANEDVKDFAISYLLGVFTDKGPDEVVSYIHSKYYSDCKAPLKPQTAELIKKLSQLEKNQTAPDINIPDLNGKSIKLSSLKNKKAIIVYFWSSGCTHCKTETPKMLELYNKFDKKGLEVYAVSIDLIKEDWKSAIDGMKLNWINVCELKGWEANVVKDYHVRATPTLFLLDSNRKIIEKNIFGKELENKVSDILK